ncbi:MAG: NERD domain-containing protein [Anaerolineae bacterium]|nr:NERD domain-containing protein [Anaerolineae bacterium]
MKASISELVVGYDRVVAAEAALRDEWRERVLAAYARRRVDYKEALSALHQRRDMVTSFAIWSIILGSIGYLLGFLWFKGTGNLFALLLSMVGAGCIAIPLVALWSIRHETLRPPDHPLRDPLKVELFPPLTLQWREVLDKELAEDQVSFRNEDSFGNGAPFGAEGERAFVQTLRAALPGDFYILHGLQQRHGDDVDALVVGPTGVWVFEVKFWAGTITWHDGIWQHEKDYYAPGGIQQTEHKDISQPPGQQWQRMVQDVVKTLRMREPWLVGRLQTLLEVKGGIVFTAPNAVYNIPAATPFQWGDAATWAHRITHAPPLAGLDAREALQVVEALLSRHQDLHSQMEVYSMAAYAEQLVQEAEARLAAWVRSA